MTKSYNVVIPIAGHIVVEVTAGSKEEAIRQAFETNAVCDGITIRIDEPVLEFTWDMLTKFNSGNVCHCPSPWQIEVEEND